MILNTIDLGVHPTWLAPYQSWQGPEWGQVSGTILIEGSQDIAYARGGAVRKRTETVYINPLNSLGGSLPGSQQAVLYLLRQLLELANNKNMQPVYIQWRSGGGVIVSDSEDGWWIIESVKPDIELIWTGMITVVITAIYVGPPPPKRVALSYFAGSVATNATGAAIPLIALPIGSTAYEANFTRAGAEGAIPCIASPVASPEPISLSATIANIFKGGVHVYDTINTGSNPVPTSLGSFVNANWVEVMGADHKFEGDCVITNGLLLLIFQTGQNQICNCYLWNTVLATPSWTQFATLNTQDNSAGIGTLRSYSLEKVGYFRARITCIVSTGTSQISRITIRLANGRFDARATVTPLTQVSANNMGLYLTPSSTIKSIYNGSVAVDGALGTDLATPTTDYFYGAAFIANASFPFIFGLLYENAPSSTQPFDSGSNGTAIGLGDPAGILVRLSRSYGFFAVPYGVSGSYSTANLQSEGESGTLGTGWSSIVDAGASAGNTAKAASGTTTGNADTFGATFVPTPGTYDIVFRVKVTSAAGSAAEMKLGLWDNNLGAFVASTTFRANQANSIAYVILRACVAVVPTAGHNMRFRAETVGTLGTDWFIDEAFMIPKIIPADSSGPQDVFQQFIVDGTNKLVVAL